MISLNQTPSGERLRVTLLGRRNSGKSSLINALTGQSIAIVSNTPGTTTDPVSKAMEILPIGPVVITDTAGLDDEGDLGRQRVERTLRALEQTDIGIIVIDAPRGPSAIEDELLSRLTQRSIPVVVVVSQCDLAPSEPSREWAKSRGIEAIATSTVWTSDASGIAALKSLLMTIAPSARQERSLVGDLTRPGDTVLLVTPIDQAAPKGRLILPQVMTLRDILDNDAQALVVKERELSRALRSLASPPSLVITDSQAFLKVAADTPREIPMTSFSILMARHKGDLVEFARGARALSTLKTGDAVLIAEGCSHHRQADDIGTVQIPRWLRHRVGGDLRIDHAHGVDFPSNVADYRVIIHCGSCTLNRREMLFRQRLARDHDIPMTNYGLTLAWAHGILDRALRPFPAALNAWRGPAPTERTPGRHWARATE